MTEIPRGLVRAADMSRNLIRRDSLLCFGHERHCREPLRQWQVRVVEQGASRGREVQSTLGALKQMSLAASLALCGDRVDLGAVTRQTVNALRPALHYQVGQRHVFGGERF